MLDCLFSLVFLRVSPPSKCVAIESCLPKYVCSQKVFWLNSCVMEEVVIGLLMSRKHILHLHSVFFMSQQMPAIICLWHFANIKFKMIFFFFFSQAPCRAELQRALDRLASNTRTHDDLFTIPIPNCDKNGDFHAKQVCECMHALFMSFNIVLERSLNQHGTGTSELWHF